ncbi:hypothetical protein DBV15_08843 [Temnothorax longispinosus]|uniref:Uncharacterized protein n=1 Tax=Temnothorax longispinosus TaxID=300112 RepID=A0A4S2JBW3_9HYME|nr:hypothetical protein DBV15_08843 [Temnothorax longispinosus]
MELQSDSQLTALKASRSVFVRYSRRNEDRMMLTALERESNRRMETRPDKMRFKTSLMVVAHEDGLHYTVVITSIFILLCYLGSDY